MVFLALCMLSMLKITNSFLFSSERASEFGDISLTRDSYEECNQNVTDRLGCGYSGISEEQCNERECCWSTDEGGPRCYYAKPILGRSCAFESRDKIKCGRNGIRKEQCSALDCCWQPSRDGPWCYEERLPPIYTGECGKTATAPQTRNWRILGGEEANPHSWPWIVSLQREGLHKCGGTVLNERWILSAAHCVLAAFEIQSSGSLVVAGAHNIVEDEPSVVKVMMEELITPDEFDISDFGTWAKDVLLIRLAEPLEFNDYISPVCPMAERPLPGRNCYSVGWGLVEMYITEETEEWRTTDELQQVLAPIIDSETCNSTDWYFGDIPRTSVCAGWEEGGRAACSGDSGGPLLCFDEESESWQQAGIASFTWSPCATALKPSVYASVADNIEWVKEQLAEYD